MSGAIARSARCFALAALLIGVGCADDGDPILPAQTLTGRWAVQDLSSVAGELELVEGSGGLSGRLILSKDGAPLGEYAFSGGTGGAGGFSFVIDPLDPPLVGFLEEIGSAAPLRVSGELVTHETLRLDVSQDCQEAVCLEASGGATFSGPLYTSSGPVGRFIQPAAGLPGLIAELSLTQVDDTLEGAMSIIIGSVLGGARVAVPIHPVRVADPDTMIFFIDPLEAQGDTLEAVLGCDKPIAMLGTLDQGSQVRLLIAQLDTSDVSAPPCNLALGTWPARPVLHDLTSRFPATIADEAFEVVVSTKQTGSVIEGTVTFENDRIRYGPLPIDDGRFAGAVANLIVHPADAVGTDFVEKLGSAAPIQVEIRVATTRTAAVSLRQDCSCLETSILANRINTGI